MRALAIFLACSALIACGSPPSSEGTKDAGSPDASSSMDASLDGGAPDASSGQDAGSLTPDAGVDAGVDAGTASGVDAGVDAGTDAGVDAGMAGNVIKTVFIIVEENQNWDAFSGSSNAPYINSILPEASYALNYSNPAGNHPSEPNYLWLEAGTNFGIKADGAPNTDTQHTDQHLVTLLNNAGVTWKSYQEDIDGTTCPLTSVNNYAPKHDPMVFFSDVTGNQDPNNAYCIQHVRPFSELQSDLESGKVAQYNFITPNLCDDGHNDCSGGFIPSGANEVSQTDKWLQTNLPMILNSQAYRTGGAVFITWDESEPSLSCLSLSPQCPIGMIVLSPFAKGGGYTNSIMYDHSSTLRTMEEIFHVQPFLGGAATATDLSDLFQKFP